VKLRREVARKVCLEKRKGSEGSWFVSSLYNVFV
jgi:hypothetical protein